MTLFSFRSLAVAVLASRVGASRRLSYDRIAMYEPESQVTDHAAVDLDQKVFEDQLGLGSEESFAAATKVYEDGGHSKSYAEVKLDSASGLNKKLIKGTKISGFTKDNIAVVGKALNEHSAGATVITIQYQTSDSQDSYVNCQVGALPLAGAENTEGCFAASGTISIDGDADYTYQYSVDEKNDNGRTIAGFSQDAYSKMYNGCPGCPYKDYKMYYDYYGKSQYAHEWVSAALGGSSTSFTNGNADFGQYGYTGKAEAAKKGSAYMNVFMYVIREFEDALDDCKRGCINCNDDPVHAWDEGVAFYTGSLEGPNGEGDGTLLYALADKRCINFRTCGTNGNELEGTSKLNYDIFTEFSLGKERILAGQCDEARDAKERIVELMAVPLIQGTLRYAYKVGKLQGGEKEKAEGASFAAAILPKIHNCNPNAATTIYNNMRVGADSTDADDVKKAFEQTYRCLGISCNDVGGLYNVGTQSYYSGYGPCADVDLRDDGSGSSSLSVVGAFATIVGAIVVAAL